jgi:tyrosyl-tRNA synthetase
MHISSDKQLIEQLLTRGVQEIFPKRDFLKSKLGSGERLTLYTGFDPTGPSLHIGHGITMLKLRQFQELGHRVIFLIGDITATIGDPTDKAATRTVLTREQVLENCKAYQEQAARILNFKGDNPVELRYNSEWWNTISFAETLELASHFTVQQMIQRDMFQRRFYGEIKCPNGHWLVAKDFVNFHSDGSRSYPHGEEKICCFDCLEISKSQEKSSFEVTNTDYREYKPIYLHEFMYPLMQGYDSVAMDVDGEVGGNDQMFNMLAGRTLQKDLQNKEKFVITMRLLTASDGKKMGKSEGNMIAFTDTPEDMFGKVMTWSDDMIINAFELCTTVSMPDIAEMHLAMKSGENPRDFKLKLAYEITKTFLGEDAAGQGKQHFANVIQGDGKPTEIPEITPSKSDIITVLVESGLVKTNSDARRDIQGGGVKVNDVKVDAFDHMVEPGDVVQKGKRHFIRIV